MSEEQDMGKNPMRKAAAAVHDLMRELKDPPAPESLTVAYALTDFLRAYADDCVVDTGHGFGESCLDFWLDDKAVRVIIKSVPELDRETQAQPEG